MTRYLLRRLALAIPTLFLISFVSFAVIELPRGDFLDQKVAELEQVRGDATARLRAEELRVRYGLDRPFLVRYGKWIAGMPFGDFGESFRWERDVSELIGEHLGWTLVVSLGTMAFVWCVSIPLGIWAATRHESLAARAVSAAAYVGMSIPGFLLALVLLVAAFHFVGVPLHGLFSPAWRDAPWSPGRVLDLAQHLILPIAVIGLSGTAGLFRVMRANMLEVLGEPFVRTARAKGLPERVVLFKHAARLAVNPLISIFGMSLPDILSGTTIVSIVLGLPTLGPLLLQALLDQDMYLAGTILFFMSVLLVAGNLLADIALAWADPRIRHG